MHGAEGVGRLPGARPTGLGNDGEKGFEEIR